MLLTRVRMNLSSMVVKEKRKKQASEDYVQYKILSRKFKTKTKQYIQTNEY